MSHKFRMEAPFLDGLSYLSREEEATARHIAVNRKNKAGAAEIDLKEGDVEAMAFIQRVRLEIDAWENLEAVGRSPVLL
jgi:poly(A)-specific ribonuclease